MFMNEFIKILQHYSPLISLLTFFLGLYIGNKHAIGRDKRQEFNERKKQQEKSTIPFPYQQILLTRLCMNVQGKLLESRNNMLKKRGINETLFMALIILDTPKTHSIQPSELSDALGSSRTNATRIADELENRKWIERMARHNDRRCLHLHLTKEGSHFLKKILPRQNENLEKIWSVFNTEEKNTIEKLMRKLLIKLDNLDNQTLC